MKDRISGRDVRVAQYLLWVMTSLYIFILLIFLYFDFSLNLAAIAFIALTCFVLMHRFNANIYNVWYENGNLYFQNIYKTKLRPVQLFESIEMNSIFNNTYKIRLKNGEEYLFAISSIKGLKLWLKLDSQFYAKKLTFKIHDVIKQQNENFK